MPSFEPCVLAEALLAFLAGHDNVHALLQGMVGALGMTLWAVEPPLTTRCADGYLGVQYVLTHGAAETRGEQARMAGN